MDPSSESGAIDATTHTFIVPEKQLKSPDNMLQWTASQAYSDLVGFILTLNEAVKNKKIRDDYHVSEVTEKFVGILETIDKWIDEVPPIDQPQRFGNKAFRTLYNRLKQEGPNLVKSALPQELEAAVPEMCTYLVESVGNDTRIDYGTGHELAFVAFLCCACRVGVFQEADYTALVLKVFDRYLYLVRKLQITYRMEPAGSQGVWSLDDYQFLPFLWGSAQLYDHQRIKPKSFPEEDMYNSFYKDYMFLAAIKYINQVKTGPFAEHSNQLWGISGVASWHKVNSGLIKMYKAEVLGKFPVVQHFLFGSLLTLQAAPPRASDSLSISESTPGPSAENSAQVSPSASFSVAPGSASLFPSTLMPGAVQSQSRQTLTTSATKPQSESKDSASPNNSASS